MYAKLLTAAVLAVTLSTAAFAQNANQNASAKGEWQASKLINMNVYNGDNQKIGDIKELMLDKSGKIDVVAIAVGGFLGMGEHDVAVKFEQLKWADAPVATTTSSTTSTTNHPAGTTGTNTADTNAQVANRNYPDHAVLNANKDQLKAMPQFDYNK